MVRVVYLLMAILLTCGCISDDDTDIAWCDEACDNMRRMQCPGWEGNAGLDEQWGTDDDITCEEICIAISSEPGFTLYPECTAQALSCEDIDNCFQ